MNIADMIARPPLKPSPTRQPSGWKRPEFDGPVQISGRDLEPIGTDRSGRAWFRHKRYGEMAERSRLVPENLLGVGPVIPVEVDGELQYRAFDLFAPGSLARLQARAASRPLRPKTYAVHDGLSDARIGRILTSRDGKPIRGAVNILEQLRDKDVRAALDTTRTRIVALYDHFAPALIVLELAEPILVPHLRGEKPTCQVTDHGGEAVTVTRDGVPWCASCQPAA